MTKYLVAYRRDSLPSQRGWMTTRRKDPRSAVQSVIDALGVRAFEPESRIFVAPLDGLELVTFKIVEEVKVVAG